MEMLSTIPVIPLIAALVLAQNPYGRITGRVTDPQGAVIPGVSVRAVNANTNMATAAVTNSAGSYEIPNLIPGIYRVVAQLEGFKRVERGPLELRVGDTLNIDLMLELGAVSESVTVTAEAPLLESTSASHDAHGRHDATAACRRRARQPVALHRHRMCRRHPSGSGYVIDYSPQTLTGSKKGLPGSFSEKQPPGQSFLIKH